MSNRFAGYRLISLFGILLILCVWLLVWTQCSFEYDREIEEAYREEMNLARVYEDHVRRVFLEVDKDLLALRKAYHQEGTFGQELQLVLTQVKGDSSKIQVGITDEQGMLKSLCLESLPYDVSDREYFFALRDTVVDRMYVGKTVLGRQSHQMAIPLSRRITKADGSFGGVFVISISPAYLMESFKSMELGPGKVISVTGLDGITRIRQGVDIRVQSIDVRSGAVYQSAQMKPFGMVRAPNVGDGIIRLNAYRVLPEYSIYVNVAMAEQDVLQDYLKRKNSYLGAATFMTIFITAFCGILIKRNLKQRELENRLATFQETTSRLVTDSADSDSLLQTITQDALRLVGAPNGLIAIVDPDGQSWTVRYGVGLNKQRVGSRLPVSEGLVGEVISSSALVYAADYFQYPRRLPDNAKRGFRSVLGLPLKIEEKIVGVLAAEWTQPISQPSEEVLDTLRQYAYLASVALERAQTQEKIQLLAFTDTLTGLPNRLSIQNYLKEEMERARRGESHGTVLFVDLDNLKLVNDTMGHSYGDMLIIEASKHIVKNAGESAFIGRLAGDEFIVILPDCHQKEQVAEIADRINLSLDRQYNWEALSVHASATIGIAFYPENGTTVEEILKNADAALYAAKKKGKRSWQFYDASNQQDIHQKMVLSSSLHQALERNELVLHYQPVLTPEGILVGFEALLRWNSPEHGSVSPSSFIPIAEQDGRLIRSIGTWVLQEACIFLRRLASMGRADLRIDVNVSARQLEGNDFVDIVLAAIDAAGIKPGQLGLEITESVLMESVQHIAVQLEQLRKRGVKISLDDFGEGYSSLTQLSMLPVDTLKISKTLINRLGSQRHVDFMCSIVNMADALGLTVVAEGVETEEQLMRAKECRCDWIQGYFFYRPMPEEEAIRMFWAGI